MNKQEQIFIIGIILASILLFQCKSGSEVTNKYVHDQVFVDMMVDLTFVNKIHGKIIYSQRELKVDTFLDQIELIHGRSISEFDTYLRQLNGNKEVYTEFLDSVQASRTRLETRILDTHNEE